ncbi:MAG: IS256 family transposase [Spirochaetota bacterium]
MLQTQYTNAQDFCKKEFTQNRFEELVQQYEDAIKALAHRAFETYIEAAFEEFISGKIGKLIKRTSDGKMVTEYRNGYRYIKHGVIGTMALSNIRIPRNRAGGFRPEILKRIRKQVSTIALLISSLYINGISTRKIRRSLERAGIKLPGVSRSTVSRAVRQLVHEYILWINRPITRTFIYIQVDTVYLSTRKLGNSRLGVMIAVGIDDTGHKEVLYFRVVGSEKTIQSDEVFQNLICRGLDIHAVQLVTTDGARGPIHSICALFGEEKLQRCIVHKTENVIAKCPKNLREEVKVKVQRLWNCETLLEAEQYLETIRAEYGAIAPKAIECLYDDRKHIFRYLSFPVSHRKTIRNTNLIERVIREVRRRTKVMDNVMGNEYSLYALMTGIFQEQNERWNKKSHWSRK